MKTTIKCRVVEKALRLAVKILGNTLRRDGLAELMKPARGVIDSGIPDLASNPQHLAGFGRDNPTRVDSMRSAAPRR
jgi:hypothetical protein